MRTHEVNSWKLEFLVTLSTHFLIKVPGCALHFYNLTLKVVDIAEIFIQFLISRFDLALLSFQILKEELFEHTELQLLVILQNLEHQKRRQDVL